MNWQGQQRLSHSSDGQYGGNGDPYMQSVSQQGASRPHHERDDMSGRMTSHSFLAASVTRESEELQRRRLEHVESSEHIAPQHKYPQYASRGGRVTENKLREHFHLPLTEVAKKFGMCNTAFKKLCRKQGVMQWPYRTLRSLEKKMASLRAEQKFTNDNNQIEEQIAKLQAKREQILSGSGAANLVPEDEPVQPSPSDDSSTSTAQSRSSSPSRASVDLSRAAFENQLNLDDAGSPSAHKSLRDSRNTLLRNRSLSDVNTYDTHVTREMYEQMSKQQRAGAPAGRGGAGMNRRAASYESLTSLHQNAYAQHMRQAFGLAPPLAADGLKLQSGFSLPSGHDSSGNSSIRDIRDPSNCVRDPYSLAQGSRPEAYAANGARGDATQFGDNAAGASLRSQQSLEQHLQNLLTENNSLRTTIRTLVKEKEAWVLRHKEAQTHIASYRMFAQDLEMQLQAQGQQQQQQQQHQQQQHQQQHQHHQQDACNVSTSDADHQHHQGQHDMRDLTRHNKPMEDWHQSVGQGIFSLSGTGISEVDEGEGSGLDFATLGFTSTSLLVPGNRFSN